jgi:hypothetical protein
VLLLLLAGCSTGDPAAAPTETPAPSSATPTETPVPVEQSALVMDVSGLTLTDSSGASASALWTEGDAVIDLIVQVVGAEPSIESTPKGDFYEWPEGIRAYRLGTSAGVTFTAPEVNGYELRTLDGITVGSTRAEVAALDTFAIDYDGDGDGLPDSVGLGAVEEPGTESPGNPGVVGTSYVKVNFTGDVVSGIAAPAGDWTDL